ncbi:hypothetical protein GCM10027569_14830 [Flindersiella endophytica]
MQPGNGGADAPVDIDGVRMILRIPTVEGDSRQQDVEITVGLRADAAVVGDDRQGDGDAGPVQVGQQPELAGHPQPWCCRIPGHRPLEHIAAPIRSRHV